MMRNLKVIFLIYHITISDEGIVRKMYQYFVLFSKYLMIPARVINQLDLTLGAMELTQIYPGFIEYFSILTC